MKDKKVVVLIITSTENIIIKDNVSNVLISTTSLWESGNRTCFIRLPHRLITSRLLVFI